MRTCTLSRLRSVSSSRDPSSTTTKNDPYPYTSLMDVGDTNLVQFLRGCFEYRMPEETLAAELHNRLTDFAEEKFPGVLLNPTKIPVPVAAHAVKVVRQPPHDGEG